MWHMKILLTTTFLLLAFASVSFAQSELKDAVDLYRAGKYQEVITSLEDLHAKTGPTTRSLLFLGAAYAQLGMEEKARLCFQQFFSPGVSKVSGDETSLKITKKPQPVFHSNNVGDDFRTFAAVEFKADRSIGLVFIVETNSKEFTKSVLKAIKKISFAPATSEGKPVTVIRLIVYSYES